MLRKAARRLCQVLTARQEEAGQALLFVLMASALLISIPLAIATTTANQLPETTRNLNWDAAYEAAQAGLNDYLQDLDNNQSYTIYNKSNEPSPVNAAFTGWVQASTTPPEYYSYTPIVVPATGLVSLEVSGKAGNGTGQVVRTFDYTVRPATSLDDIYWSNYETVDPNLGSQYSSCDQYYQSGSSPASGCVIEFDTADVLDGPVFSNDTFRMCGSPTFKSTVESGNSVLAAGYTSSPGCGSSTPIFQDGSPTLVANTPPQTAIPPSTISAALTYGCEFTGNVTLVMTAVPTASPPDTSIAWSGGTLASGSKSWCGSGSSGTITTKSMTAALIYTPGNITVSGSMAGSLDLTSQGNIATSGSITYPSADIKTAANGTMYDAQDILGLVAQNFISINPTTSSGTTIDAAILSLQDSFYLPNWGGVGQEGTLTVFGSIAQNNRGPVGTATSGGGVATGFSKSYHYDTSLQTLWPPYFVPPTSAAWNATAYSECVQGLAYSVLGTKTVC
ncbi:MAG: hypothetical protein ACRDY1_06475 [Acidimicrobiales bacterium]